MGGQADGWLVDATNSPQRILGFTTRKGGRRSSLQCYAGRTMRRTGARETREHEANRRKKQQQKMGENRTPPLKNPHPTPHPPPPKAGLASNKGPTIASASCPPSPPRAIRSPGVEKLCVNRKQPQRNQTKLLNEIPFFMQTDA